MKKTVLCLISVFFPLTSVLGCNGTSVSEENKNNHEGTDVPAVQEGWHLTEKEYFVPDIDLDVLGGPVKSTMSGTGDLLLDYYQDTGSTGDLTLQHTRTDANGKVLAMAEWRVIWSDPSDFLPADKPASISAEHILLADWGTPALSAYFDSPDMKPGRVGASPNVFHHLHGEQGQYRDTREEIYNAKETSVTEYPLPVGKTGDRYAVYIHFGEGYGMRYTYEWRPS